uniref:Putative secreted protein n=1 Tax=Ixodes ricinus TaxID=34613 RepID=A0A6B0TW27_IXORI
MSGLVGASVSLLRLVVVVAASVTVVGLAVTVGVSSEALAGTLEVLGTVVVELKSGEWGLATFPAVVVAGSRLVLGK